MSLLQKENSSTVEDEQRDNEDISECEIDELKENYQVVSFIAKGSYGRVFKVQENATEKFFALKLIRKPESVEEIKVIRVEDKDIEAPFGIYTLSHIESEKRILENIGYHPFTITLHDSFETSNLVGLLMNYVEGITLVDYMISIEAKFLPEDHVAFYAAELSLALHHLHKKGIIHRDLKLNNVMIDLDGHIKLIDYGSAIDGVSFQQTTTRLDVVCNYLSVAPEIVGLQPYNHQCDWYQLGIIICELITGRHPFISDSTLNRQAEEEGYELTDDEYKLMLEAVTSVEFQFERSSMSEEAYSLLEKLLHWVPDKRIGINDDENRMEISECAFLKDIDWARLERREVDAPFKPLVKNADQSKDPVTKS